MPPFCRKQAEPIPHTELVSFAPGDLGEVNTSCLSIYVTLCEALWIPYSWLVDCAQYHLQQERL
jgi:hypothetical protein